MGAPDAEDEARVRRYIALGPDAVLAAANTLLDPRAPEPRARGARRVLMSLETDRDLAFLDEFHPAPSVEASCNVVEILHHVGQAMQYAPGRKAQHRVPIVPLLARHLVRLLDEPWPTCEQRHLGEPGYSHPHVIALELLDDMYDWTEDFDGSLARCWDECGPETIATFKTWWARHHQ